MTPSAPIRPRPDTGRAALAALPKRAGNPAPGPGCRDADRFAAAHGVRRGGAGRRRLAPAVSAALVLGLVVALPALAEAAGLSGVAGQPKGPVAGQGMTEAGGKLRPEVAFALVGVIGVGAQWLAWRLRMPAIVLMLLAGLAVGPVAGILRPERDIGAILGPMIAVAVAIILFEGGLNLDFKRLGDARIGVRRLVWLGAPLGWLLTTLALRWVAGFGWGPAAVFGGIMIVTGPTVIAPLLRQARIARRPAALLQWEAIVGDPLGALAAVLAFEVVLASQNATSVGGAVFAIGIGLAVAAALGMSVGYLLVRAFRGGHVAEYMKVPILFSAVLMVFALADGVLDESGLLAVTLMGVVIANAELPSVDELRRFKENATVLLVSGVFVLLSAGLTVKSFRDLNLSEVIFVAVVFLVVRPATVFLALLGSPVPWRERLLVALSGPRGIVLVAVAALFGQRLVGVGMAEGKAFAPLAFLMVGVSVVIYGFSLRPLARYLGLGGAEVPGVILVGATRWAVALAEALGKAKVPVLISDPDHRRLARARGAGLEVFSGDILSEVAEHNVELVAYDIVIAATDNDAYNTLVATDLGPEFGRDNVFQTARDGEERERLALPPSLGGRGLVDRLSAAEQDSRMIDGWSFGITRLTEEFRLEDWRAKRPRGLVVGQIDQQGRVAFLQPDDELRDQPGTRLLTFLPPEDGPEAARHPPAPPEGAGTGPGGLAGEIVTDDADDAGGGRGGAARDRAGHDRRDGKGAGNGKGGGDGKDDDGGDGGGHGAHRGKDRTGGFGHGSDG